MKMHIRDLSLLMMMMMINGISGMISHLSSRNKLNARTCRTVHSGFSILHRINCDLLNTSERNIFRDVSLSLQKNPTIYNRRHPYFSSLSPAKINLNSETKGYNNFFDLLLPEGRCVGLQLLDLQAGHPDELSRDNILCQSSMNRDHYINSEKNIIDNNYNQQNSRHWIYDKLHPDEIDYGLSKLGDNLKNQRCFWLGRLALRECLLPVGDVNNSNKEIFDNIKNTSILKDSHGRPQLPKGFLGSVSHKQNVGIALVAVSNSNHPTRMGIGVDIEKTKSSGKSVSRYVLTPHEISDLGSIPVSFDFFFNISFLSGRE